MSFYLNYFNDLANKIFGSLNKETENESNSATTSFKQSSCLQLLSALSQQEWRIPVFWSNLFEIFMNNMNHPYKAIREKNAS
jgi:hypothetical protein